VFRGPLTPQSNAIRVFIEELRRDDRSIVVFNHLAKVGLDYNAEKKSSPKVLIVLTYVLLCCLYKLGNSILILLPDAGFTSPYYFLSFLNLLLLCRGTPCRSQSFYSSKVGISPPLKGHTKVSVFFRVGGTFPIGLGDPRLWLRPRTF
jgi:hypothetical protein